MIYFLDFKASYTIYMIQNKSRVSKLCSWSFKTMWGGNYPTLLETQNFMTPCYFGAPKVHQQFHHSAWVFFMNVIFNISLCFHAHAWNMSAFLFYTIPSIRLIHPSLFCIFCKFFEIRCSNSASYFKCQISMPSIIPYLLILYVLSKLHDRIKHFSIFLRCKRTAPHRILSCIWVVSLFSSLVLVAIKNTYIPKAQKEPR